METSGGSRAAATSKMKRFVIIVNGFQPLTIITKGSILDAAAALDPPLETSADVFSFANSNTVKKTFYSLMFKQVDAIVHTLITMASITKCNRIMHITFAFPWLTKENLEWFMQWKCLSLMSIEFFIFPVEAFQFSKVHENEAKR